MEENEVQEMADCRAADISAYIDGELSSAEEFELNLHLTGCSTCSEELNRQKTFLNFVGTGLSGGQDHDIPEDLVRIITTTAESGVHGVRGRREFLISGGISLVIGSAVLALLGGAFNGPGAFIFAGMIDKTFAVVTAVGNAVYSLSLGIAVITRALTAGGSAAVTAVIAAAVLFFIAVAFRVGFKRSARSREYLKP